MKFLQRFPFRRPGSNPPPPADLQKPLPPPGPHGRVILPQAPPVGMISTELKLPKGFKFELDRISMRGRVSRTNVVRGGEVSVTIRFGLEERAKAVELSTGTLVSVLLLEQPATKPSEN